VAWQGVVLGIQDASEGLDPESPQAAERSFRFVERGGVSLEALQAGQGLRDLLAETGLERLDAPASLRLARRSLQESSDSSAPMVTARSWRLPSRPMP